MIVSLIAATFIFRETADRVIDGFNNCRGLCTITMYPPCANTLRLFVYDSTRLLSTISAASVFILPVLVEVRKRQRVLDEDFIRIFPN